MKLYRINYEEYLHYEEFIEASSPEEAERIFKNSIETLEPVEAETYTFDVEEASEHGKGVNRDLVDTDTKTATKQ